MTWSVQLVSMDPVAVMFINHGLRDQCNKRGRRHVKLVVPDSGHHYKDFEEVCGLCAYLNDRIRYAEGLTAMQNVDITWEDDIMVIRVDTAKRLKLSETNKTILVATTKGSVKVGPPGREKDSELRLGLNVYVPNAEYVDPKDQGIQGTR